MQSVYGRVEDVGRILIQYMFYTIRLKNRNIAAATVTINYLTDR